MQEPERYLAGLGIELHDPIDPKLPAVIDVDRRIVVNHEIYFFASRKTADRFERDPLPWCGLLTDPVTQQRFRPAKSSPKLSWKGRAYYFASKDTAAKFEADPDAYRLPRRVMPPRM